MMHRHPMDRGQAIVVGKVHRDYVQNQRLVRDVYTGIWLNPKRNALLPFFQFTIELSDNIQELAVSLLEGTRGI